ncbi:hypothetical protein OPW41_12990 [Vibrio europaeus]|uniref:ribonuclease T2 family protein n=1 Tax=Vibrio europaeus TaxID=300876 RepID=UPI00233F6FA3|nr:hypothetical protein [Vibrio europaeus]MDC5721728.1 hypothetical protein [Vibrio europaeus]MDC5757096.1 hypothetical protein [Vibrio europaeus]MDC5776395.1 hypothetical protein [Vibrio europaeus]MDC5795746.1 hypothetical protein [Vibrio europaeus]MDC5801689.1 hypothetical protein [Vibrio europaeus]
MKIRSLIMLFTATNVAAADCIDPNDTYVGYNDTVKTTSINDIESDYYVLSYSWAPAHCQGKEDTKPGQKNYLQCHDPDKFGYILHGLWPQGKIDDIGNYPRACEGDYPIEISREILNQYLCMTPSVWLLQHEYEYHGTCMHDETLESPEQYFATALKLHNQINLPRKRLPDTEQSRQWFVEHNQHINLKVDSLQYWSGGHEWQICFDNEFALMPCPVKSNADVAVAGADCLIKGNISQSSQRKLYFTPDHPNYPAVKIHPAQGERCFSTEQAAQKAGWTKA